MAGKRRAVANWSKCSTLLVATNALPGCGIPVSMAAWKNDIAVERDKRGWRMVESP